MEHKVNDEGFIILEESVPGVLEARINTMRVRSGHTNRVSDIPDDWYTSCPKYNEILPAILPKKKRSWRDLLPKIKGVALTVNSSGVGLSFNMD